MSDADLIKQTVLDYFEGWFDADVDRMNRALHSSLVKRPPADDDAPLAVTTKARMVELTAAGGGPVATEDRRLEIEVVDVHGRIASVVVRSVPYREYLHLVRVGDSWRIANALWDWTDAPS